MFASDIRVSRSNSHFRDIVKDSICTSTHMDDQGRTGKVYFERQEAAVSATKGQVGICVQLAIVFNMLCSSLMI